MNSSDIIKKAQASISEKVYLPKNCRKNITVKPINGVLTLITNNK